MCSPLNLEQPARWQSAALLSLLGFICLPVVWLLVFSSSSGLSYQTIASVPFASAVGRTLLEAGLVTFIAFCLGLPVGLLFALFDLPGRRWALSLFVVPLFLPTFIWAIGWSMFKSSLVYRHQHWLDGLSGSVIASCTQCVPLAVLATVVAVRTLATSQLDAARLAGGARALLRQAARRAFPFSGSAALLGGIYFVSDPGTAQIMGYHGVASEILIAFSARYDLALAAGKTIAFMLLLLPVLAPVSWWLGTRFAAQALGRDLRRHGEPYIPRHRWALGCLLILVACLLVFPPLAGSMKPLAAAPREHALIYALGTAVQTWKMTVLYSLGAGLVAAAGAFGVTLLAGRSISVRRLILFFCFLLLSLPAASIALGLVALVSQAPAAFDPITRSGLLVALGLGLRLLPLATVFLLWRWSCVPASANEVAALHRIPLVRHVRIFVIPVLLPTLLVSLFLVAILATSDGASVVLLQPPGSSTFMTRLFSVMDNASEKLVAALCLTCVLAGTLAVALFGLLTRYFRRQAVPR